jgi:hypothetical protein
LQIPGIDPGAWHMNRECSEAWADQMCVEYLDERQIWVCPKGAANHAWDISVYGLCLADYVGTRYMQPKALADDAENDADNVPMFRSKSKLW